MPAAYQFSIVVYIYQIQVYPCSPVPPFSRSLSPSLTHFRSYFLRLWFFFQRVLISHYVYVCECVAHMYVYGSVSVENSDFILILSESICVFPCFCRLPSKRTAQNLIPLWFDGIFTEPGKKRWRGKGKRLMKCSMAAKNSQNICRAQQTHTPSSTCVLHSPADPLTIFFHLFFCIHHEIDSRSQFWQDSCIDTLLFNIHRCCSVLYTTE